ncbi:hypothetical protein [Paraburkholderia hospita]|jgi:hypothetical protein|uniref:Uncharacterized protein n=1 Tax=Paraburkholderia hospita TaxID=169430 RepID=A0ABP2PPY9_9BURK|nr:hypothetical protein [Paraburkholderia hospita]AXF06081.1 hypothetical protein CUJ88_48200 [Paraburkholderia hospita]EIM99619.1 hypothetical protein WQE_18094 [Paraburkholderia hospita]OUL75467.1 hypothetical protein CA601_41885 [Paraburkholderia hospita]OUL87585.1 hypothetical protein CA602_13405 [Paraburkholderia hospita]
MDIIKIARESGFVVLMEGRIGQDQYTSVCGTEEALKSFAEAMQLASSTKAVRSIRFRPALHTPGPGRWASSCQRG